MRLVILVLLVAGLMAVIGPRANPATIGKLRVAATVTDVRSDGNELQGARRFVFMRLWQRPLVGPPIGHAFLACVYMGNGGIFGGSGVWNCQATYRMPRGYIMATGVIHSFRRYTLAITGGTGLYQGQGGTNFVLRTTDGVAGIYMALQ